ncbi:MAG: hypothetical protein DHS20C21_10060 [Gemmatimonadota bacterium]|nr:MAG: hypothetical protein DHS20C21_10060 [Gemmatimonadota bacterium]
MLGLVLALAILPGPEAHAQSVALAAVPREDRSLSERTVAFFFANEAGIPIVPLDAAAIDSVGEALSQRNLDLAWRVDHAYRSGKYGTPGERDSRNAARAAYMYSAETAFDFFLKLALQEEVIYSTSESALRDAFAHRFRNPGLYPIVNLKAFRTGFGQFCMEFEVDDQTPREIVVTGEPIRAWTEEMEIDGVPERVVNIDMKTMSHDRVQLVYRRYATGTVTERLVEHEGQQIRMATMENVTGQFVRKWGLHRPSAIVLWRTTTSELEPPPANGRLLGSAVYFPKLQLKLPWFLPDLGFEDLRRFDFPQPLLSLTAVLEIRDRDLDWLRVEKNLRFAAEWEGDGDVPEFVNERYPDH